jgi:hypothetical protein
MKNLKNKRAIQGELAESERLIQNHKIEKALREAFLKAREDEKAAYQNLMNHLKNRIPAINDAYNYLKETIENPWEAREVWEQWAITNNK